MMSKHTPGPWFYGIAYVPDKGEQPLDYMGPGYYDNAGILAGEETIVGCDEYDIFGPMNKEERQANIRLIAAAPDLLEALQRLTNACQESGWPVTAEHMVPINCARAAIAKATGEK